MSKSGRRRVLTRRDELLHPPSAGAAAAFDPQAVRTAAERVAQRLDAAIRHGDAASPLLFREPTWSISNGRAFPSVEPFEETLVRALREVLAEPAPPKSAPSKEAGPARALVTRAKAKEAETWLKAFAANFSQRTGRPPNIRQSELALREKFPGLRAEDARQTHRTVFNRERGRPRGVSNRMDTGD